MKIGEKPTKARLGILTLLFIAVAINYMDRANLSVGGSAIQGQFKLSSTTRNIILSIYMVLYHCSNTCRNTTG
jgi:ACS family D-galactonate transporter-like MFS transporter